MGVTIDRCSASLLRQFDCALLLIAVAAAPAVVAQPVVRGTVYDSLAARMLAGATVRLVPADSLWVAGVETRSDSSGRFAFSVIRPGRYLLGVTHARLDTLGLDAAARSIVVQATDTEVPGDVGIPSGTSIGRALCDNMPVGFGVAFGRVRSADAGRILANATITAEWRELALQRTDGTTRTRSVTATVGEDGRYVLCGVPTDVTVVVSARGSYPVADISDRASAGTSGRIDLTLDAAVPALHRDVLVASPSRRTVLNGTTLAARGTARLRGRIVSDGGTPVVGARVILPGDAAGDSLVTTDSSGRFRFDAVRGGSYRVDVTSIGFNPARFAVDLQEGDTATVSYVVVRPAAELEPVTVSARASFEQAGFEQRRGSRRGFFRTSEELAATGALVTSMALVAAPMLMQWGSNAAGRPVLTGPLQCTPLLFVDGVRTNMPVYRRSIATDPALASSPRASGADDVAPDLDLVVPLSQIGGVEVYAPGEAPARFADPFSRCSSIVLWTNAVVRMR